MAFNGDKGPTPRYANLEEFRSEFGSYRVNKKLDKLVEGRLPISETKVGNDPYQNQVDGLKD